MRCEPIPERVGRVAARQGEIVMERAWVVVCGADVVESVTSTVNAKVPEVLGVPEMSPVDRFSLRPAGSEPRSTRP
jgi:hypothetical protein